MVEIVFYCPRIPVITIGKLRVVKDYPGEYLVVVKCYIHLVEEMLEEAFPDEEYLQYDYLTNLIIVK